MKNLRQVNIKNCPNCLFNSMTNIENFATNLLGINQAAFTSTDSVVYDIEYFTNLDDVNFLHFVFDNVDAYIECNSAEENNGNKCLVFALTDKNKEALENYTELWDEIKDEIKTIRGIQPTKYEKDFMKIRFESDDNLPLGKILNILVDAIIVKSVFQVHLHVCFYEHEYEYEDDSHCTV